MSPISTNCPTCQKPNTWSAENKFKPFCSERCKLIDLGAWIEEKNRVPGDPAEQDQPQEGEDNT